MEKDQAKLRVGRQIAMASIQISSYIRTSKSIAERISLSIAMSLLSTAASLEDISEAKRLIVIAKNMAKVGGLKGK